MSEAQTTLSHGTRKVRRCFDRSTAITLFAFSAFLMPNPSGASELAIEGEWAKTAKACGTSASIKITPHLLTGLEWGCQFEGGDTSSQSEWTLRGVCTTEGVDTALIQIEMRVRSEVLTIEFGDPSMEQTKWAINCNRYVDSQTHSVPALIAPPSAPVVISPPPSKCPECEPENPPTSIPEKSATLSPEEPPDFADFKVPSIYRGRTNYPQFNGRDSQFKELRTRIRNALRDGPTFSGKYSVVQFGCGTQCSVVLLANNQTGQVFSFPLGGETVPYLELLFQLDSSLMIVQWADSESDTCYMEYFNWTGGQFKSMHRTSIGDTDKCFGKDLKSNLSHD